MATPDTEKDAGPLAGALARHQLAAGHYVSEDAHSTRLQYQPADVTAAVSHTWTATGNDHPESARNQCLPTITVQELDYRAAAREPAVRALPMPFTGSRDGHLAPLSPSNTAQGRRETPQAAGGPPALSQGSSGWRLGQGSAAVDAPGSQFSSRAPGDQ
jgi:hypothetical protein